MNVLCFLVTIQDQEERIDIISRVVTAEIERHCYCGFTSKLIVDASLHCFTASPTTVTFRASLENSNFLPAIQNWISDNGTIQIENVTIEIDKYCQVVISNLTEPNCISNLTLNSKPTGDGDIAAIIGGGVAGGISLLLVILLVVTVTKCRTR